MKERIIKAHESGANEFQLYSMTCGNEALINLVNVLVSK